MKNNTDQATCLTRILTGEQYSFSYSPVITSDIEPLYGKESMTCLKEQNIMLQISTFPARCRNAFGCKWVVSAVVMEVSK